MGICYIAPTGRIEKQLPTGIDGELVLEVPLVTQLTFYTRYGEWFAWLCVATSTLVFGALRLADPKIGRVRLS